MPDLKTAKDVWDRWGGLIAEVAASYVLQPHLIAGMVCQESAGNTFAVRSEPGFFRRYLPGLTRLVARTPGKADDNWIKYPDLFAASYGLLQCMYPVAIERGLQLRYPTELCDPTVGLQAGCAHFRWCLDRTMQDERKALLRYNGGGDPDYPDKILRWASSIRLVVFRK